MSSHLKIKQTAEAERPRRGRPPALTAEMRRQRILDTAERIFTEIGYGAATMEEIARGAGMSKKTLYGVFPDKREVFTALIHDLDGYPSSALEFDAANSRKELRARLLTLAEVALSTRQVEVTRLVISEACHCPELAEEFHAKAMQKGRAYLARALQSFVDASPSIVIENVEATAVTLFAAVLGDLHFRALLGEKPVGRKKLEAHIDACLDLVLPNLGR
jgi:TetR/AcrR family transcriptional repressor of mexJK operon